MRKSLTRRLSRLSVESHMSAVLDPDSNISFEDEAAPLWFKDLEDNSIIPLRYSSNQNDTPVLDSNSEPSSTPQQKSWWKDLDDSPEPRGIRSDMVREQSYASEKSHESLELSDASSKEISIAKQKSTLRQSKRRSTSKAMFSLISESSKDSVEPEKVPPESTSRNKQPSNSSFSSFSDNESVKKVRKLPFKKKRVVAIDELANPEQQSHATSPDVFQHALNDLGWADNEQHVNTISNSPRYSLGNLRSPAASSTKSAETLILEPKDPLAKRPTNLLDESEDTLPIEDKDDDAESLKLSIKPQSKKKRTILTQTHKRKSPNFENLLNDDESEDETGDQHRIDDEKENESNRDEPSLKFSRGFSMEIGAESTIAEDESGEEDSVRKQRAGFFRKRRKTSSDETAGHFPEFPNASNDREPIHSPQEAEQNPHLTQQNSSPDIRERSSNITIDRVSVSRPSNRTIDRVSVSRPSNTTIDRLSVSRPSNTTIDRVSVSRPLNTEAAVQDSRSDLRTLPSQDVRVEESSIQGIQRPSAIERSYRTVNSDSSSDEPEERRTPSLQIRRSIVRSTDKQRNSVREKNSSRQLYLTEQASFLRMKPKTPENSNQSMRDGSPTEQNNGKTGNSEDRISSRGVMDQQHPNSSHSEPKGVSRVDNHAGSASTQLGLDVNASFTEKLSEMRGAIEELKKKELALMKTTKIDSYFKSIPKTTTNVSVQPSQKPQDKVGSGGKDKNKKLPARCNKAYLVNGQIYKRPKLPRPKHWVTDHLYNYLWKKMEPKYKLKTRIRSERLIINLSETVSLVTRRKKYENYKEELEDLMLEMARLEIIETKNDFHIFCRQFLPYNFRIKVIPMILPGNVRNIPFDPDKLFERILEP